MTLSVVIITYNEEANIARTLQSVMPLVRDGRGEIIVVDSGSTDRTIEIAKSFGAKVFVEEWKGYAAQKNSAIDKATGDWILSLDADEEVDSELVATLRAGEQSGDPHEWCLTAGPSVPHPSKGGSPAGLFVRRRNYFLGRSLQYGGFWPDPKLRLFQRGRGRFEDRAVHEDIQVDGRTGRIQHGALIHHSYPTLSDYIDHMNHYSSLGAEMVVAKANSHFSQNRREVGHPDQGHPPSNQPSISFSLVNIVFRPLATFIYNYFFRLGFLDGREGLLLHLYHSVYVSWKYAKAWETGQRH